MQGNCNQRVMHDVYVGEQLARRQLEARVVAQRIKVGGIFVAAGGRQYPRL